MEIVGRGSRAPSWILLGEGAPNVNYLVPATDAIDEGVVVKKKSIRKKY